MGDLRESNAAGDDRERFWAVVSPRREPLSQRWFAPVILLLLALSVPWYWPRGAVGPIVWGLPLWVWICVACSFGIASVTAWVALRCWDDDA